jgi:hypothetical protein
VSGVVQSQVQPEVGALGFGVGPTDRTARRGSGALRPEN